MRFGRRAACAGCLALSMSAAALPVSQSGEIVPGDQLRSPSAESVLAPAPQLELDVELLVAEVLSRNPDVRAASAAWRAAAERYPQEVALDDPMFGYMLGPGSWGNSNVNSAYAVEASQKLPWPGKRQLRGNISQAKANAAYYDVGEERLRIAEATRLAYYQYFLAHRQLAVLAESTKLLQSFRETAKSRFEAAEVEQQDVLLADVEIAQLAQRELELERAERVARARINTLLLIPADAPLSPPPERLPTPPELPSADAIQAVALAQRPELAAAAARIRAERYGACLAQKEFYPDVELVARYDSFWQESPLRSMVGMNLNLPIYKDKRYAAAREANAHIAEEQATLEGQISEIAFAVEESYQRVQESRRTLDVYEQRLLPAANDSVKAAQASYTTGRLDFLRLIESQRQFLTLQDRYYEAIASYHQRLAELDRAIGTPLPR